MEENGKPKKFWTGKKITLATFLVLVLGFFAYHSYRDKALKLVQTDYPNAAVDHKKGEEIDYRYLYDEMRKKEVYPIEENGMRDLLRALGPIALGRKGEADRIPWEMFPTNDDSREWFENVWTPLCEDFQIDPREKPTMLGRLSLSDYIAKNGWTGEEPNAPEKSVGSYWENFEEHSARVAVDDLEARLTKAPWTEADYPNAARWIDENADFYDLIATAARKPRVCMPRVIPDSCVFDAELPEVQSCSEFARLFSYRAHLRVGRGDLAGTIDDIETIMRLGKIYLEPETSCFIERLVGMAMFDGRAVRVSIYGNKETRPTRDDCERLVSLWSALANRDCGRGKRYGEQEVDHFRFGEYAFAMIAFQDFLKARRDGTGYEYLARLLTDMARISAGSEDVSTIEDNQWLDRLLRVAPMNDPKAMSCFKSAYMDADFDARWSEFKSRIKGGGYRDYENFLATIFASIIIPNDNNFPRRHFCANQLSAITNACFAYQAENGTLPPAFSVDDEGKPIHSWRTLILPYLDDECRALYDQIKLDEPWDSEHNRQFHDRAPNVYRRDDDSLYPGETFFSVLLGDDGFFDESGKGKNVYDLYGQEGRDIARQALIIQAPESVCWMRPGADLKLDALMKLNVQETFAKTDDADSELAAANFQREVRKYSGSYAKLQNVPYYGKLNSLYSSAAGAVLNFDDSYFRTPDILYRILRGLPEPSEASAEGTTGGEIADDDSEE